jgi:hypothetical protein
MRRVSALLHPADVGPRPRQWKSAPMLIDPSGPEADIRWLGVRFIRGGEFGAKEIGKSDAGGFLIWWADEKVARGVQMDGTAKDPPIERLYDT